MRNLLKSTGLGIFLTIYSIIYTPIAYAAEPARIADAVIVIENIIKLLVPAAAIAFFFVMIFGGFKFLTSGGDPKAAASARSTLTYGIIGIILVIASWLILLTIGNITGKDVTNVSIPPPAGTITTP